MKISKSFVPHPARNTSWSDQLFLFTIGLASILEGLVIVLSLGFLNIEFRAWVLFDLFGDR
jgi:hypothetical protein